MGSVTRTLLPHAREGFTWYEHYPARPGRFPTDETFDMVAFRLVGPFEVAQPRWTPSSRAAVEALIGRPLHRPISARSGADRADTARTG